MLRHNDRKRKQLAAEVVYRACFEVAATQCRWTCAPMDLLPSKDISHG